MRINRRFKVLTLGTVLLYIMLPALVVALCAKAIHYNAGRLPVGAWVTMGLVCLGFVGFNAWIIAQRIRFAKSIDFTVSPGVDVILGPHRRAKQLGAQGLIEKVIHGTIQQWAVSPQAEAIWPTQDVAVAHIQDALSDTVLQLTDAPISYSVWLAGGPVAKLAYGLAHDRLMIVSWKEGEPTRTMLNLVKHEASHIILTAMLPASTEDEQHQIMTRAMYE